jgi:HAMP domain-containing protein
MKLLEDIKELGDDIHAAIHAMIAEMFREDLDEDVIDEIVSNLGLTDLLALDRAYTEGDQEAVRKIIGPLPQLEYSMGRQASSMASNRPKPGRVEKPQAKDKEAPANDVTQTNRNYNQGAANAVTTQNIDDEDPDAVMQDPQEPIEESVESWSKKEVVSKLRNASENYMGDESNEVRVAFGILADYVKRHMDNPISMLDIRDAFLGDLDGHPDLRFIDSRDVEKVLQNPVPTKEASVGAPDYNPARGGYGDNTGEGESALRNLADKYQAIMAGMDDGDENEVLDMMQDVAARYGLDMDDYLENPYESVEEETNVVDMVEWLKRRAGIA